jgi:pantoate--beta-alanine ligase
MGYIYTPKKRPEMDIFSQIEPLRGFLEQKKLIGKSVGFVPTMGALHEGHLTLIRESHRENEITVCSIYVNPTQFNNADDLARYPRTIDQDITMLESVGCNVLFYPSNEEIYPKKSTIKFEFGPLEQVMEGKFRPGHFSGVATVVSKLLNIVQPARAYFGQKDYQQFKIVECLVQELKFNVQLRCVPIQREMDGLAMSSRNMRLTEEQRKNAIVFYESLQLAKRRLAEGHTMSFVREEIKKHCESKPGVKLEYLELTDASNFVQTESVTGEAILLIAGYVGEVRLIDNLLLKNEN